MDIQEVVDHVQYSLSNLEDVQSRIEELISTAEDIGERAVATLEALQEDVELLDRIGGNLSEAVNIEDEANNIM